MFKNRFYKATLLVTMAMSVCSCNKFLDLRPQNGITSDQFWQTKEQLQGAVIGIYNTLLTGPATDFFDWGEARADYVAPGTGITPDELNITTTNILPTNAVVNWAQFYKVINLCNNVLDNGPGVATKDGTLTSAALDGYLGEALAIRALMYFYLVRSFDEVPLSIKYFGTDSDLNQLAKSPQSVVLDQIIADLKQAEIKAVDTYGNIPADKGRITKLTASTILADVYLWRSDASKDDYTNCIAECDKVINSGKFGLVPGTSQAQWFNTLYVVQNSIEGIFELQYDTQSTNPFFNFFSTTTKPRYLAYVNLIDNYSFDPNDVNNIDIRSYDVAIHAADQSIYKYIATSANTTRSSNASSAHWIFYRYADILMMKAEALINLNRGQEALDIINQIRTRAHALPGTAQSPAVDDKSGLTDYLVAERGREFAFEGKRWYDLLRNAKRDNYSRLDLLTDAALISVPSLNLQSALNKIKDPHALYFPIPQTDITNDPNLIQNPFYQ